MASVSGHNPDREGNFHELMNRVREGDSNAAWELLDRYGRYVLHVIRQNLQPQLRSKFDSTDFYQNVWASFFAHPGMLQRFSTSKEFLGYLAGMAKNKLKMENRKRFNTKKHNVNKESSLESVAPSHDESPSKTHAEPMDAGVPTPSYVAMVREEWDQWMAQQSKQSQKVVELRFRGASFDEIADELHINEKTARRVIDSLIGRLGPPEDVEEKPKGDAKPS